MSTFTTEFEQYSWEAIQETIYQTTTSEVALCLQKDNLQLSDFLKLLSPAARPFLEQMAQRSHQLTKQRFGNTMQLYAPLYLSNECQNICTYCGFSMDNNIRRRTLDSSEILQEGFALQKMGFQHVLLVSGESNHRVDTPYFLKALTLLKPFFAHLSLEVQPLDEQEYKTLQSAQAHAILVYQETYHKAAYKKYHPKGKKSNFNYRLETPDRIGRSGMHKIGLGVLLGLADWRVDSFFNALHITYLQKSYWKTKFSVSFPRLRPASGVGQPNFMMEDADLIQLICAYRLWNPDLELSLSTREDALFRDQLLPLGITSMSAASKTNPGGYVVDPESLEQFEISDERPLNEVVTAIRKAGFQPVWKDWTPAFNS